MNTTENTTRESIEIARSRARRTRFIVNAALTTAREILIAEAEMGEQLDEIIEITTGFMPYDRPQTVDLVAIKYGRDVFPVHGTITPEPVEETIIDEEPIAVNVSWLRRAVSIFAK
jgi:hypothetical protein